MLVCKILNAEWLLRQWLVGRQAFAWHQRHAWRRRPIQGRLTTEQHHVWASPWPRAIARPMLVWAVADETRVSCAYRRIRAPNSEDYPACRHRRDRRPT